MGTSTGKRGGIAAVVALASAFAFVPATAGAAPKTYEVNKTGDPVPGACTNSNCTLREAFRAANSHNGADVIEVERKKTYTLEQAGAGEEAALTGDLDSTGKLTLRAVGSGNKKAKINAADLDRALDFLAPGRVSGIAIRNGNAPNTGGDDLGGGIRGDNASVALTRSSVTGSEASGSGAGIAVVNASLRLVRSSVFLNDGHGVHQTGSGGVTVKRSNVSRNAGDGIQEFNGGDVVVQRSRLIGNGATGVLEFDEGSIRATDSKVNGNEFQGLENFGGGGITVIDSAVNGNGNQGIQNFDAGGINVVRSEVNRSDNQAIQQFADGPTSVTRTDANASGNQGIQVFGEGSLTVTRTQVNGSGNQGVELFGNGRFTVARSQVNRSDNQGIENFGDGRFTVSRTEVKGSGNQGVESFGDGAFTLSRVQVQGSALQGVQQFGVGPTRITRALVAGNENAGVEIFEGAAVISSSTIRGTEGGGGVATFSDDGALRIERTTIARNIGGSGLEVHESGAIVTASTISGNRTEGDGGGVLVETAPLTMTRSTVAGNRADEDGGGIDSENSTSNVSLNGVTVARNISNADNAVGGAGGGLFNLDGTFTVRNSLIVLNDQVGGDANDCSGTYDSLGDNLLTELVDCTFGGPGDLVRANPKVGKLKRNGGPTKTVALKAGSPAIGKAHKLSSTTRDQRDRKRDDDPDIGAFER